MEFNVKAAAFAKANGSFSLYFDATQNYVRPDDAPWTLELGEKAWAGHTAEEAIDFAAQELFAAEKK